MTKKALLFLDDVKETKRRLPSALPITLKVIALDIARALGVKLIHEEDDGSAVVWFDDESGVEYDGATREWRCTDDE